jgi:hypothetical protein
VHSITGTAMLIVQHYYHYSKDNENQLGANAANITSEVNKYCLYFLICPYICVLIAGTTGFYNLKTGKNYFKVSYHCHSCNFQHIKKL